MTPPIPYAQQQALHQLLRAAVAQALTDLPLEPFADWFADQALSALGSPPEALQALDAAQADEQRRMMRCLGRAVWAALPLPQHQWRPRPLPKSDRNGPCHCGSGRKYKQCCAGFATGGLPLEAEGLLALVLEQLPPQVLTPQMVGQLPAATLAMTAHHWNEQGEPGRTAALLAPLFEQPKALDDRHEPAFDVLMDALLALGQEREREQLALRVGQVPAKALACGAWCRLASLRADRGEDEAAWQAFREAQRRDPRNPQLWHLEMTLLLHSGREPEARLRAKVLAAQARRDGYDEMASMLLLMGEHGLTGAFMGMAEHDAASDADTFEPDMQSWLDMVALLPADLDPTHVLAHYQRERLHACAEPKKRRGPRKAAASAALESAAAAPTADAEPPTLSIRSTPTMARIERHWSLEFGALKPMLADLQGDAGPLLDRADEVLAYLRKHPAAWFCVEVIDDLLLAGVDLQSPQPDMAWLKAQRRLCEWALSLLTTVAGAEPLRMPWAEGELRPWLRLLAQAIDLALLRQDHTELERLAGWGLRLNPGDNHGWRELLVGRYLAQSRWQEALDLSRRYPDDFPPAAHRQALALYALGQVEEAQQVLAQAHQAYPLFVRFLLPESVDAPPPEDGPGMLVGGAEAAWNAREDRPAWVRSGALAWVRGLKLPTTTPRKRSRATQGAVSTSLADSTAATAPVAAAAGKEPTGRSKPIHIPPGNDTPPLTALRRLRKEYPEFARLVGLLQAIAWSPGLMMPSSWLEPALALRGSEPRSDAAFRSDLQALMTLYNHLNEMVLSHAAHGPAPLAALLSLLDDTPDQIQLWAAGFVQGAELNASAWRNAKLAPQPQRGPFGGLYALASRAGPSAQGWQARSVEGQPLLAGLEVEEASPKEQLRHSLQGLWQEIAPVRQRQAKLGV